MGLETLSGVFEFVDRNGVPLFVVMRWMLEKNFKPCWVSYIVSGKKHGWTRDTIFRRMREAVIDVHGKDYWGGMEEKTMTVLMMVFQE